MYTYTKRFCALILAVLCLAGLAGCSKKPAAPDAGFSQMVNPLVEVASIQEMEEKLGYSVPVLEKAVAAYIVLVIDGKADTGRIHYADGTVFNMKKGTGDISGIYGGTATGEQTIGGVTVCFYAYEDLRYATWENGGFAYSLSDCPTLEADVAALIG